jgi:hypothetical protein
VFGLLHPVARDWSSGDTHALIWWLAGDRSLSAGAREA